MDIREIKRNCVVGGGTMGSQIAMQVALSGYDVILNDISEDLLQKAIDSNRGYLEKRVKNGKLTQKDMDIGFKRLTYTTNLEDAGANAHFVIEAVFEDIDVKKNVFAKLDKICPPSTIIATNSSLKHKIQRICRPKRLGKEWKKEILEERLEKVFTTTKIRY